jgi:hypothetical protein
MIPLSEKILSLDGRGEQKLQRLLVRCGLLVLLVRSSNTLIIAPLSPGNR